MRTYCLTGLLLALVALSFRPGHTSAQKVGEPAFDFTGVTTSGDSLSLSSLSGKIVVLDFWASWCGPCLQEMPYLIDLYNDLDNSSLEIVAINVDEYESDMNDFLTGLEQQPPFPIVLDSDASIASQYDLAGMPTTVFVDRNGIAQYVHSGFTDKDKKVYREKIIALLASNTESNSN